MGRLESILCAADGGATSVFPRRYRLYRRRDIRRILSAIIIEPDLFATTNEFPAVPSEIADPERGTIFCDAALIYGLELLAAVATISPLRGFLIGKNVVIYVDNSNTTDALVRARSPTKVINIPIQIFWAFAQCSGARFWFEQVPTNRNIANFPTRMDKLPTNTKAMLPFPILNILKEWATKARRKGEFPLFTNGPTEVSAQTPRS